jgi:hypothetical protein
MFGLFGDVAGGEPAPQRLVDELAPVEARLLWAVRRLALMQPIGAARCHAVHIALQQEFGDAGMGVEHLLRCILVGLSRCSTRRLAIGAPGCALVTGDEAVLLALMQGRAGQALLVGVAGSGAAVRLMPLFVAVAGLLRTYMRPGLYKIALRYIL